MSEIRLQKYIADCGVTSRRKAEDLIVQGRVLVNGEVASELGTKVSPGHDAIVVDGQPIDINRVEKMYILLNKPRSYVTTVDDPEGRKTVMDLVKEVSERIYPVGRLDYLSEGLLLLTNDGDLANTIMHPSHEVIKVYEVKIFGAVTESIIKRLRDGAKIDSGFVKPKSVRVIQQLPTKTWVEFRLGEGKNREIRKLCESVGLTVDKLRRVAIGAMTVEGIAPGKYRFVSKKQIEMAIAPELDGSPVEYFSAKRTINLKKRGVQNCTIADDRNFRRLRRETYFKSLEDIKTKNVVDKATELKDMYAAKEAAHMKRKNRKTKRDQTKAENQNLGVHAQFIK